METYLGKNIRYLRSLRGWTQSDVSKKLGYGSTACQNWELGRAEPTMQKATELAALFDVSLSDLVLVDMEKMDMVKSLDHRKAVLDAYITALGQMNKKGQMALKEYADYLLSKPEYQKDGEEE